MSDERVDGTGQAAEPPQPVPPDGAQPRPTVAEAWAEVASMPRPPDGPRIRPGRPRVLGGGLVRAAGLLGVLLTIALLAVLGARVLSGLGATGDGARGLVGGVPVPPAPDGVMPGPGAGPAGASQVACDLERSAVDAAVTAFMATRGRPPADAGELVAAGLLDGPPARHTVRVEGGAVTVDGTGDCAGG